MAKSLFEKTKDSLAKLPVADKVEFYKEVKEFVHEAVIAEQKRKEEEANELQLLADRISNQN